MFQARFAAFAHNYEYIQRENAKGHSYELGLNEFSDMSMDEFKMGKLGMMPESMWGDVPSGGMHKVSNASLPKSVDWRSKAVTPVKNQKQCGSCASSSVSQLISKAPSHLDILATARQHINMQLFQDVKKAFEGAEGVKEDEQQRSRC